LALEFKGPDWSMFRADWYAFLSRTLKVLNQDECEENVSLSSIYFSNSLKDINKKCSYNTYNTKTGIFMRN